MSIDTKRHSTSYICLLKWISGWIWIKRRLAKIHKMFYPVGWHMFSMGDSLATHLQRANSSLSLLRGRKVACFYFYESSKWTKPLMTASGSLALSLCVNSLCFCFVSWYVFCSSSSVHYHLIRASKQNFLRNWHLRKTGPSAARVCMHVCVYLWYWA